MVSRLTDQLARRVTLEPWSPPLYLGTLLFDGEGVSKIKPSVEPGLRNFSEIEQQNKQHLKHETNWEKKKIITSIMDIKKLLIKFTKIDSCSNNY